MRAAVITGKRLIELREFPDPEPSADGIVVDIAFCGICGTDVGAYTSGRPYRPSLCGHEWAGTVSAAGAAVRNVREGDRVVVGVPEPCGRCLQCAAGNQDHCVAVVDFVHGRNPDAGTHGGFASRIAVPEGRVVAAHPDLDDETLAQVEPVTICVHAVARSGLRPGDTAVVLGAGPVGMTAFQCAIAAGAAEVVVVEPDDDRRSLADRIGARQAPSNRATFLTTTPESAPEVVAELTSDLGADVVIDCVGGSVALSLAVGLARRGGTVCMVGLATGTAEIEPAEWLRREITVTAAIGYRRDEFSRAMQLLADRRVDVSELHTSTTCLDGLADTFEDLADGRTGQLKVLLDPNWNNESRK